VHHAYLNGAKAAPAREDEGRIRWTVLGGYRQSRVLSERGRVDEKNRAAPERPYIKRQSDRIINSGCAMETPVWKVSANLLGEVTFTRKSLDHGGC
jgi:hypothetical protein